MTIVHDPVTGQFAKAPVPWWRPLLQVSAIRKAVTFVITAAGVLVANGLIAGTAKTWTETGVLIAGLFGIYAVPNAPLVLKRKK